jgi:hypothetical protein
LEAINFFLVFHHSNDRPGLAPPLLCRLLFHTRLASQVAQIAALEALNIPPMLIPIDEQGTITSRTAFEFY